MKNLLLGIDVGTSGVKAIIYHPERGILGSGRSSSYAVPSPRNGESESEPELWWRDLVRAANMAFDSSGLKRSDTAAIGLSVIFPVALPMDKEGRALHPAIMYNDQRSVAQVREIEESLGREAYEELIGNTLVPGTCSATSLLWIKEWRPDIYAKAACIGLANTFITKRLTGRGVTDPSNASLSGLASIRGTERWSERILSSLGIDEALLPPIARQGETAGLLSPGAAESLGLPAGTPVVPGSGDAVAAAFGAGVLSEGTVFYVSGSTDCVTIPQKNPMADHRWITTAFTDERSYLGIGTSTSAGSSVEWFIRTILGREGEGSAYAEAAGLAEEAEPGSGGVLFLPYLQGERTPIWDPFARGSFAGLSGAAGRREMARAVYEGTAFALRDIISCFEGFSGTEIGEIIASGGGTLNETWNRIKADVLQKPLSIIDFKDTSSLGAALFAGMGAGTFGSAAEAGESVLRFVKRRRIDPDEKLASLYGERFALYQEAYRSTKGIMKDLSGFRES
jgi:xylulokinase